MDREADFEQVAERLNASGLSAEVVATGGGIDCVVVTLPGGWELYFGTSAEMWGASVYKDDEYVDKELWTKMSSNEADPDKVAAALKQAADKFRGDNKGVPSGAPL
jgi:hypothetical protein